MDWTKDEEEAPGRDKKQSPCDVEALKKCLEANNGDPLKCHAQIKAFKSSCALKKPPPSPPPQTAAAP